MKKSEYDGDIIKLRFHYMNPSCSTIIIHNGDEIFAAIMITNFIATPEIYVKKFKIFCRLYSTRMKR